jgi:hypothetical protein
MIGIDKKLRRTLINAKNGISSGTLDAKTKAITFLRLSKTTRPYKIPYTIELKSSVRRVI